MAKIDLLSDYPILARGVLNDDISREDAILLIIFKMTRDMINENSPSLMNRIAISMSSRRFVKNASPVEDVLIALARFEKLRRYEYAWATEAQPSPADDQSDDDDTDDQLREAAE